MKMFAGPSNKLLTGDWCWNQKVLSENKEPRRNSEIYQQDAIKSAEISFNFENCLIFPWTPFIQGFSLW